MPTYGADNGGGSGGGMGGKQKTSMLLSPPPRVGSLSLSSRRTLAHLLALLSAIVVFGSVANTRSVTDQSDSLIVFLIVWTVVLAFIYLVLLVLVWRTQLETSWSPKVDMLIWGFTVVLWIPVVGVASSIEAASRDVTIWFAWIGFAATAYAMMVAYHVWVESDLPTPNPEGFDDDDYIYG